MTEVSMPSSYEQACAEHDWDVPERYNIAADVCDKHPRDKPAMVWERFDGATPRGRAGASSRTSPTAPPTCCATAASSAATASPSSCRRRPRRPRSSSAPGSSARSCSRCRCSTATTGSATASRTPSPKVLVTDAANAGALRPVAGRARSWSSTTTCSTAHPDRPDLRGHRRRRPRPALLHVGHDRQGEGHRPRPPLHPRPRGVHLLPRGPGRRALPRHGRVGLGGGHRAAARPVAARRGPVRLPARGRLRPAQAARLPLPPRGRRTSSRRRPRCGR